jgi:hypothetical protein
MKANSPRPRNAVRIPHQLLWRYVKSRPTASPNSICGVSQNEFPSVKSRPPSTGVQLPPFVFSSNSLLPRIRSSHSGSYKHCYLLGHSAV